jgi:hypothetical protein
LLIQSLLALLLLAHAAVAADPLPSWNDTAPKKAIVAFVDEATKPGSRGFVPVEERTATFDKGLDEALAKGWTVASMKDDWKIIYASEKK